MCHFFPLSYKSQLICSHVWSWPKLNFHIGTKQQIEQGHLSWIHLSQDVKSRPLFRCRHAANLSFREWTAVKEVRACAAGVRLLVSQDKLQTQHLVVSACAKELELAVHHGHRLLQKCCARQGVLLQIKNDCHDLGVDSLKFLLPLGRLLHKQYFPLAAVIHNLELDSLCDQGGQCNDFAAIHPQRPIPPGLATGEDCVARPQILSHGSLQTTYWGCLPSHHLLIRKRHICVYFFGIECLHNIYIYIYSWDFSNVPRRRNSYLIGPGLLGTMGSAATSSRMPAERKRPVGSMVSWAFPKDMPSMPSVVRGKWDWSKYPVEIQLAAKDLRGTFRHALSVLSQSVSLSNALRTRGCPFVLMLKVSYPWLAAIVKGDTSRESQ